MKTGNRKFEAEGKNEDWIRLASEILVEEKIPENIEVLYNARNKVLKLTDGGIPVAAKLFSRSIKNRLVYSLFRTKAERSYHHGKELLRRGIHTPEPLAYYDLRGPLHTLRRSIYLSRYEEATDLKAYLASGEEAWREFAAFAAELHRKGIIHKDLNNTNVRVRTGPGGKPEFSLIDLNRMDILPEGKEVDAARAAKNLVRFSYLTPEFEIFAQEYGRQRGIDAEVILRAKRKHEKVKG